MSKQDEGLIPRSNMGAEANRGYLCLLDKITWDVRAATRKLTQFPHSSPPPCRRGDLGFSPAGYKAGPLALSNPAGF